MARDTAPRFYTVLCDSRKQPGNALARCQPGEAGWRTGKGFWTDSHLESVGVLTLQDAEEIQRSLRFNNPRVVRYGKALRLLAQQILSATPGSVDPAALEARVDALLATAGERARKVRTTTEDGRPL